MIVAIEEKAPKPTDTTATVPTVAAKAPCACEAHKKRIQASLETACSNNAHTSKIQKATSVLMFLAFLLICIALFQKITK